MYDPARDVFQPTENAVSANTEEQTQDCHSDGDVSDQVVGSIRHLDHTSMNIPTPMSSETNKKRQRTPSPASEAGNSRENASSPPPEKRRRSSLGPQSPELRPAGQTSSEPEKPTEVKVLSPQATKSPPTAAIMSAEDSPASDKRQNGHVSPPTDEIDKESTNRSQIDGRNQRQGHEHKGRLQSPPDHCNADRGGSHSQHHSPSQRRSPSRRHSSSRRYRNRSPIRRRDRDSRLGSAYSRRDPAPPPRRSRSPSPIPRSPPQDDQPSRRPGGGTGRGRNVLAVAQRLAEERERDQQARNAQIQRERGVQHMSNQFYNSRPEWVKERGREWRKNESKIKGLRSFNNWIKSCIIQKFSPEEAPQAEDLGWGEEVPALGAQKPLLVLDIGCGKGGDLGKWQLAPQTVGLYVGLDPADQSVAQARDRYAGMRRGRKHIFDARFQVKDCFGEWIGDIPIVREVGIDPNVGNGGPSRWSGGGFDVVTMMFSMHYAFESEQKARMMLRNVAGSLKKGGRFIGVVPNSDAISERVVDWWKSHKQHKPNGDTILEEGKQESSSRGTTATATAEPLEKKNQAPNWGNSLYSVRFNPPPSTSSNTTTSTTTTPTPPTGPEHRPTPTDGIFRDPPFGWKYMYWMEEAVDVPEYVVPWEAFRALAERYNLEQRYRKPFLDIWHADKDQPELRKLSFRMGVRRETEAGDGRIGAGGGTGEGGGGADGNGNGNGNGNGGGDGDSLSMSDEEKEAVGFYHAFCFVKV